MKTNIYKPILFNTEMVQAILAGRKTQTRRIVKEQFSCWDDFVVLKTSDNILYKICEKEIQSDSISTIYEQKAKKIKIIKGDILWVRESFQYSDDLDEPYWYKQKYKEDFLPEFFEMQEWKPSIHMPKKAARIFLKVTNVRCERLQDINRGGAMSEGCPFPNMAKEANPLAWFSSLWDSINGKKYPWENNPWVWVYEFEQIEKPADFLIDIKTQLDSIETHESRAFKKLI